MVEYEAKFARLAKYAPALVVDEVSVRSNQT